MKVYKSSDLTHKRAEVLEEAEANGVIIQQLKTNGAVVKEFILVSNNGQAINDLYNNHLQCNDGQCTICSYDW